MQTEHRTETEIRTGASIPLFSVTLSDNGGMRNYTAEVLCMDDSDRWLELVDDMEDFRTTGIAKAGLGGKGAKARRTYGKMMLETVCSYVVGSLTTKAAREKARNKLVKEIRKSKGVTAEQVHAAYKRLYEISSPFVAVKRQELQEQQVMATILSAMPKEMIEKEFSRLTLQEPAQP